MMIDDDLAHQYVLSIVDRAVTGNAYTGGVCFACGGQPTTGRGEHVIPGWLQKRFKLFNQRLTLLNGTFIPYRSLTVPCCESCNNGFLREIENRIKHSLIKYSPSELATRLSFARWLCKILIGILVKETALPADRKNPIIGNIITPDFVKEYTQAQLILQSERKPTAFHCLHGEFPFTIFMYSIYPDERFGEFDLTTNVAGQSIAIRFDQIGAIFVNDGGLQLAIGTKGPFGLDGKTLHPVQFSEVAARVHYKAALRDASHTYISAETPDRLTITQTQVCPYTPILLEDGAQRIFRPWDDTESVRFIKRYQQVDWEPVYDELTGMCTTTLMDDAGKLPSPSAVAGTTPRKPKA